MSTVLIKKIEKKLESNDEYLKLLNSLYNDTFFDEMCSKWKNNIKRYMKNDEEIIISFINDEDEDDEEEYTLHFSKCNVYEEDCVRCKCIQLDILPEFLNNIDSISLIDIISFDIILDEVNISIEIKYDPNSLHLILLNHLEKCFLKMIN